MIALVWSKKGLAYTGVTLLPILIKSLIAAADASVHVCREHYVSVSCLSVSISITKHFMRSPS
jgi:hypothetical protein